MGNKENGNKISENTKANPQPVQRNASLNRFKPSPLSLEHNNRLLPQRKDPQQSSNILKPPPSLQQRDSLPTKHPPQNLNTVRSKFEKLDPKNAVFEKDNENNILDSQSISSYHFNEIPASNDKKTHKNANSQKLRDNFKEQPNDFFKEKPRDFFQENPHHDFKEKPRDFFKEFTAFSQENADPVARMREYLLSKRRSDLHLRFFKEDAELMYISLPITTRGSSKLTPFRNNKCKTAQCLYDIEELLTKFKESMFSTYTTFLCVFCRKIIDLRGFFFDLTLSKIIEEVWRSYNRVSLQCKEVTFLRNGFWEPNLPEYLKLLERNLAKTRKKPRIISNVEDFAVIKPARAAKTRLGDFAEFSLEDYKEMDAKLLRKGLAPEKPIVFLKDYSVSMRDYLHLRDDSAFPATLMSFFIQFIQDFQAKRPEVFSKDSGNKTYIFGIKVLKFDKFYKKARFEYLPGPTHIYKGKTSYIIELYSLICLMILLENRWICVLIDLNTFDYYPIDFLQEDLSAISLNNLNELILYLVRKELSLNLKRFNVYNLKKFAILQDFGLLQCYFFYKFLTNPDIVEIAVDAKEKSFFKKQFAWLLLRNSDALKKQVLVFEFERTKAELEAEDKYFY